MSQSKLLAALCVAALALCASAGAQEGPTSSYKGKARRVLLISIDGMHSLDYQNCVRGVSSVNGGASYCPNLAELGEHGVNYLNANTSKPSDSFPGLDGDREWRVAAYGRRVLRRGLRPGVGASGEDDRQWRGGGNVHAGSTERNADGV